MKRIFLVTCFYSIATIVRGQDSTDKKSFTITGYAETYYQYDFNKPTNGNLPGFIYNHNRHNEFNLNLGFFKVGYNTEKLRANIALAAGTYMNANYAAEQGTLKNVFEANVGIKLSNKKNIWLDAGILPSHIGFENAVSKDCWTVTRSLLAENSPYFEAAAKITFTTDNSKWIFSGMALNGWQRITRVNGNSLMSWGTQIQFKPSDKILLNYSTFIGTDKPDSARLTRHFHNIYGIANLSDKLGLTVGIDIGTEQKAPAAKNHSTWYSPVAIIKYTVNNKWAVVGRAEYYNDKDGVIISTGTVNGFQTIGYSLNIDFAPLNNVLVRIEGRKLSSKDKIFSDEANPVKKNVFITTSIAVCF